MGVGALCKPEPGPGTDNYIQEAAGDGGARGSADDGPSEKPRSTSPSTTARARWTLATAPAITRDYTPFLLIIQGMALRLQGIALPPSLLKIQGINLRLQGITLPPF